MMSLRLKLCIALAVCFAALIVYGILLSSIYMERSHVEKTYIARINERRAEEQAYSVARSFAKHAREVNLLTDYFVTEANVPKFIERLENTAKMAGVAIRLSSITTETVETDPKLSLVLQVDGSFDRVLRFLRALELMPLQLKVESLRLVEGGGTDAATGELRAPMVEARNLAATAYWTATVGFKVSSFMPRAK